MSNKSACTICFALIALLNYFYVFSPVLADDEDRDDSSYDGSQFNGSSFADKSFAKHDYRDIKTKSSAVARLSGDDDHKESGRIHHKRDEISTKPDDHDHGEKHDSRAKDKAPIDDPEGHVIKQDRSGPVAELPGDWVPDKLDPTSNGGFGVIPDNGAPVPYRLNGHVDIQRGRP